MINHKFGPKTMEIIRSIRFEDDHFSEEVQRIIDRIKQTRSTETQEQIQQKMEQDKIERKEKERLEMREENNYVVDQYASYLALKAKMLDP